ncbi:MAG: DUF2974 domain-containing protein [Tissierellia bacterium]|nr:DUF2974 domain-containing protein [Tissierellia bacterium]
MFSKNIIDYVYTEKRSFEEFPFNRVDSLVFSQLSYLDFSENLGSLEDEYDFISLKDLAAFPNKTKYFQKTWSVLRNKVLLKAISKSNRFKNVEANFLSEKLDEKLESQFCACTLKIDDDLHYIVFRGTDTSLVGWKEDFNMSYTFPVPAQEEALKYLEDVAEKIDGRLLVGGHSKGGNMAVYASVMAGEKVQSRIDIIYSHDGPGFMVDLSSDERAKPVIGKIEHTIPQGSVVGLLMHGLGENLVIRSKTQGLVQHFSFNWLVEGDDFVIENDISPEAAMVEDTIDEWLAGMDTEARKNFVNIVFSVLETGNIRDLKDVNRESIAKIPDVVKTIQNMEDEEKKYILIALKSLITLMTGIGIKEFSL